MGDFSINSNNYKTYFAWEKFKHLDKDKREELIRFSIEQIRKEKGLKDVKVDFFSGDPSSRGSCTQDMKGKKCVGHIIRLNNDVLTDTEDYYSPYSVFNTINHELEHASQYEHASNRHIKNSDPATLEQRLNDQHYFHADGDRILVNGRTNRFDPKTDFQMYRAQACEAEARAAGYAAVEGLKIEGKEDIYLDSYLKTIKAREINNNKQMMRCLGMHSREEMAKEELSYLSERKVKKEDRQRVLEYARQKDYETAKEIFRYDSRGKATEEQMKAMFDSNRPYSNFYETEAFKSKKVNASNHDFYTFANYKWEDNGEVNDEIDIDAEAISSREHDFRTQQSFGQKVKGTLMGLAASAEMEHSFAAYKHGYKTTAGYDVSLAAQGAVKLSDSISRNPGGSPSLVESAEAFGRLYDQRRALNHPDEVIDFSPSPVPQEIIEKNTLIVDGNPYSSADNQGDAAFFESVETNGVKIDISEDRDFFVSQERKHSAAGQAEEDRSFFEKVEQKVDDFGQKVDEKLEGAMQKAAEVATVSKGQKQ